MSNLPLMTNLSAAPFVAVSAWVTSYLAFNGDMTAVVAITISVVIGVVLYASAFVWLGLMTTQAMGFGLLYIVLWEGFLSGFVSGVHGRSRIEWSDDDRCIVYNSTDARFCSCNKHSSSCF